MLPLRETYCPASVAERTHSSSEDVIFKTVGLFVCAYGSLHCRYKWDSRPVGSKPENGLLNLRSSLNAYANLRPCLVLPQLAAASTLKDEIVSGVDIMIVRELVGGLYFGEPRVCSASDTNSHTYTHTILPFPSSDWACSSPARWNCGGLTLNDNVKYDSLVGATNSAWHSSSGWLVEEAFQSERRRMGEVRAGIHHK